VTTRECGLPMASWVIWQPVSRVITDPVMAMTEGVAFAIEELASDNQVEFVLNQRKRGGQTIPIVTDTALVFGRSMLHRFDVDWEQHGYDEAGWTSWPNSASG